MKILNRLVRISLPVLLLVSFVIPFMPADTAQADGENWLTGYDYRKAITINGSTDGQQTNYTVKLLIGESSGATGEDFDLESHVETGFSINFTSSDGETGLYHRIISINGTTPNRLAEVWVNIPTIAVSPNNTTIYCYYGRETIPDPISSTTGLWQRYGSNPVLEVGTAGQWDDFWVQFNSIIKVGSTYYGYYQGSQSDNVKKIGLATSSDGITWTKSGSNPIVTPGSGGSWDDARVGYPVVWVEGTDWFMMYQGSNSTDGGIGLATSSDGVSWSKSESNPVFTGGSAGQWDSAGAQTGTTVLKEDSTYYMFYTSTNGTGVLDENMSIGYATSTNLTDWTRHGDAVLSGGGIDAWDTAVLAPTVMEFDGTYYMWYEGVAYDGGGYNLSQTGLATSSDKNTWTKDTKNPVLTYGGGSEWDSKWAEVACIIQVGDEWRMYYGGSQGSPSDPRCEEGYAVYTSVGDGENTFVRFEDFEWGSNGDSLDDNNGSMTWAVDIGTGVISLDQAYSGKRSLKLAGGAQNNVSFSQVWSNSLAFAVRVYKEDAAAIFYRVQDDSERWVSVPQFDVNEDLTTYDGGFNDTGYDGVINQWETTEQNDIDFTGHTFDWYWNGVKIADDAAMYDGGSGFQTDVGVFQANNLADDTYIGMVFIRKWTSDEPVFNSAGSEEEAPSVSAPTVSSVSSASVEETTANLTGNITATGGENPDTRGFQWGTSTGVYSTNQTESGNFSTGTYWLTVTSLPPGDEVYWRATANNSGGYGYGSEMYLETKPNDPSALTGPSQTSSSINLTWSKGTGAENTTIRYQTGSYPATYNDGSSAYNGNGTTVNVTGLSASTTYFFRAWSISTDNTTIYSDGYSQVTQATSAPGATPPTVTTSNATDLNCSSVTGNGNITSIGSANVTYRGFQYGIGAFTDNVSETGNYGTGVFDISITGLSDNTEYQYRAFAQNDAGISYGSSVNFTTTASSNPTFTTVAASSITDTTARLNGTISGLDCDQADDTFWEWGLSTGNYTANYTDTTNRSNGAVYHDLSSLTANTTYYFRGAARLNGGAWQYGSELNFTTDNTSTSDISNTSLTLMPIIILFGCVGICVSFVYTGIKSNDTRLSLVLIVMGFVVMIVGIFSSTLIVQTLSG